MLEVGTTVTMKQDFWETPTHVKRGIIPDLSGLTFEIKDVLKGVDGKIIYMIKHKGFTWAITEDWIEESEDVKFRNELLKG